MATKRRREKELESLKELKRQCDWFDFQVLEGSEAPTYYLVSFFCATWVFDSQKGEVVHTRADYMHQVEITLHHGFPNEPPRLEWKTDIFHPNIADGQPCILGNLWDPERSLADICRQLIEMAQFKNYDPTHHLRGAEAAAQWVRQQPPGAFPSDTRPIRSH